MVFRVGISETVWQFPTLVLKMLTSWNDSYAHEWLEIDLHMLPDCIDCRSVLGIAQLLFLTYLHPYLLSISKASLASTMSITCSLFLLVSSLDRCLCKGCAILANPLMDC